MLAKKHGSPCFFCVFRSMSMRLANPLLEFETALWDCGIRSLAGVDEAGRGALAGPLVAGAVSCENPELIQKMLDDERSPLVRDSKTLSFAQRQEAKACIAEHFERVAVGIVSPAEIDYFGVAAANRMAMERALWELGELPEFLLIDAMTVDSGTAQWGIIDGDAQSFLIAAASIVAKVERDAIMAEMGETFGAYAFSRHRGYCTAQHLEELDRSGPCAIHRRSFEPVRCRLGPLQ
jgi:ribonuclease HII